MSNLPATQTQDDVISFNVFSGGLKERVPTFPLMFWVEDHRCYDRRCGGGGWVDQTQPALRFQNTHKQNFSNSHPSEQQPGFTPTQLNGHQRAADSRAGPGRAGPRQPSTSIKLKTAFPFFLTPCSHAMCRPNLCWPCTEGAEGSNFSSGSDSADELILVKELDTAVGDALRGSLGLGGGGVHLGHRGGGVVTDAATKMSVLGGVDIIWSPVGTRHQNQPVWAETNPNQPRVVNVEQTENPASLRRITAIVSFATMERSATPFRRADFITRRRLMLEPKTGTDYADTTSGVIGNRLLPLRVP